MTFLPLTPEEYRHCHSTLLQVLAGEQEAVSGKLTDNRTGEVSFQGDTPFNAALITACAELRDQPGKPESFFARYQRMFAGIAQQEARYARYYDAERRIMHTSMVAAIARVAFSERTTPKALKAAFAAEFERQRATHGDAVVPLKPPASVNPRPGYRGAARCPAGRLRAPVIH